MSVTGAGVLAGVMVAAFLVQRLFGLVQGKDIRQAYVDLYRRRHKTCCVTYGKSKDYLLFKGCMLILAVNARGIVEEALKLEGRTIFSRIHQAPELVGTDVAAIAARAGMKESRGMGTNRVSREDRLLDRALSDASVNAMDYLSAHVAPTC